MTNQNLITQEKAWLETSNLHLKVFNEKPVNGLAWREGYSDPYLVVNLAATLQSFEVAADEGDAYKGPVVPGDFSFVPPGVTLGGCYQGAQMRYACITFPTQRLNPLLANCKPLIMRNDPCVKAFAEALSLRGDQTGPDECLYRESITEALVQYLQLIHLKPDVSVDNQQPNLARLTSYIQDHIDQRITVAELADLMGISSYALQGIIRRHFDQSVYEWVTKLRLERSMELLRSTKRDLASIALSSGFSNQSHWTRVFRRQFGITPGKFRSR